MNKYNIGIMTFHRAHNYGAFLQAYALQSFLEKEYNPYFLDYYNSKIYDNYKAFKPIGRNLIKWPKRIICNLMNYKQSKEKFNIFNNFIEKELNIRKFVDYEYNRCNFLITGSDQVWNPNLTGGLLDEYTLNFGKKEIVRISYAASCGCKENIENNSNDFKSKLNLIDKISVREESCINILNSLLDNKKIDVVLDPTLLLTYEQWNNKIKSIKINNSKEYIFAYLVAPDKEFVKIVNKLTKITGLKVMTLSNEIKFENQIDDDYIYNPFEFIKLIKDAKYVVTTSFHATVFSIIFKKIFWVVPHRQTGSRVVDLLSKLEISDRIITSLEKFNKKDLNEKIDYEKVNRLLEVERKKSIDWLYKSIDK